MKFPPSSQLLTLLVPCLQNNSLEFADDIVDGHHGSFGGLVVGDLLMQCLLCAVMVVQWLVAVVCDLTARTLSISRSKLLRWQTPQEVWVCQMAFTFCVIPVVKNQMDWIKNEKIHKGHWFDGNIVECHSLNMGPLSMASWPRKRRCTKVKGHKFKISSCCTTKFRLWNISAQNQRLGPYSYRILACTHNKNSPPHIQTDRTPDGLTDRCLRQWQYPSSLDKSEG